MWSYSNRIHLSEQRHPRGPDLSGAIKQEKKRLSALEDSGVWLFFSYCEGNSVISAQSLTSNTQAWQEASDVVSGPVFINHPDPPGKYVNSHCTSSVPPKSVGFPFLDGLVDTLIHANERNRLWGIVNRPASTVKIYARCKVTLWNMKNAYSLQLSKPWQMYSSSPILCRAEWGLLGMNQRQDYCPHGEALRDNRCWTFKCKTQIFPVTSFAHPHATHTLNSGDWGK